MSSTRAAIRYAKAILDLATSKNVANEISNDMFLIATTINGNWIPAAGQDDRTLHERGRRCESHRPVFERAPLQRGHG